MHHLTCRISSLLHSVNLILFTLQSWFTSSYTCRWLAVSSACTVSRTTNSPTTYNLSLRSTRPTPRLLFYVSATAVRTWFLQLNANKSELMILGITPACPAAFGYCCLRGRRRLYQSRLSWSPSAWSTLSWQHSALQSTLNSVCPIITMALTLTKLIRFLYQFNILTSRILTCTVLKGHWRCLF